MTIEQTTIEQTTEEVTQENNDLEISNTSTTEESIQSNAESAWSKDFKSSDDLYKAYTSLKEEQSQELNFNKYVEEYQKENKLSDESYKDLYKKGLSKDVVETFIKGQVAQQTLMTNDVKSTIGNDNYEQMTNWARDNLSKEEIDSYNKMVTTADVNQAKLAVQGLYQKYQSTTNNNNNTILAGSTNNTATANTYKSSSEVIADMKTDRYRTDPAFRSEVANRLKDFTY